MTEYTPIRSKSYIDIDSNHDSLIVKDDILGYSTRYGAVLYRDEIGVFYYRDGVLKKYVY